MHGGFESLVSSEHQYRQATREQGVLNLGMQRIDVRCSALESISTQATLVAGFAFGSLQPDVLDTLLYSNDDVEETVIQFYMRNAFAAAFVGCSAIAFAASIWVIYMALYVGYKAQFSALQGHSGFAVSTSLQILLSTNERIAQWFNVALVALAIGASLMAYVHLDIIPFASLMLVFFFFVWDGHTFREKLNESFAEIGNPADEGLDNAEVATTGQVPSAAPSAKLDGRSSAVSASMSAAVLPDAATRARMQAYQELRGEEEGSLNISGWLYKSPSRHGPAAVPSSAGAAAAAAKDKRFFTLHGTSLKWFMTEDEATLQRHAKTEIDVRMYTCREIDEGSLTLSIQPISPHVKKSWFLRAVDKPSYDRWRRALHQAGAGVGTPGNSSTRGRLPSAMW